MRSCRCREEEGWGLEEGSGRCSLVSRWDGGGMLQDRFPGFQPCCGSTGGSPALAVQLKAPGARGRAVVSAGNHHPSSLLPHHVIISSPFGFFPFILIYVIPVWFSLHFSAVSPPHFPDTLPFLFFYFIFYHSSHLSPPFPWLFHFTDSTPLLPML